jgi:hypothetical protein
MGFFYARSALWMPSNTNYTYSSRIAVAYPKNYLSPSGWTMVFVSNGYGDRFFVRHAHKNHSSYEKFNCIAGFTSG